MSSRREFITLLGGAAAAWPLAAGAQQPERIRRIGLLLGFPESDVEGEASVTAFQRGLQELGWSGHFAAMISASILAVLFLLPLWGIKERPATAQA